MTTGLTNAALGALGGALTGGLTSGIGASLNSRNFWNGEYSQTYLQENGINLTGQPVAADDLTDFANNNFQDRINRMQYKPTFSVNDKIVGSNQAITIPRNGWTTPGSSDIYLKSSVLSSDKRVFYTLDHELTHASFFSNGKFAAWESDFGHSQAFKLSEFYAYHGGLSVAKSWNDITLWKWTFNKMLSFKWY